MTDVIPYGLKHEIERMIKYEEDFSAGAAVQAAGWIACYWPKDEAKTLLAGMYWQLTENGCSNRMLLSMVEAHIRSLFT